jgi:hypothetical protein
MPKAALNTEPDNQNLKVKRSSFQIKINLKFIFKTIYACRDSKSVQHLGCQMVCFQTKNPDLGKFLVGLRLENICIFIATWNILWRFGVIYDGLVHFVFIMNIFFRFWVSCTMKNLATLSYILLTLGFDHV